MNARDSIPDSVCKETKEINAAYKEAKKSL